MDILDLMHRALDKTNDPDAILALDRGITEIERLREALRQAQCNCEEPCLHGQWCSSWIALNALKEKE